MLNALNKILLITLWVIMCTAMYYIVEYMISYVIPNTFANCCDGMHIYELVFWLIMSYIGAGILLVISNQLFVKEEPECQTK